MKELSENLLRTVDFAEAKLRRFDDNETTRPILQGGWSRKQVIAHLIDSASNNHQRFVRAAQQRELVFPGYDQVRNIEIQDVQSTSWLLLVALWASYNRYLAHVLAKLPSSKLETLCTIGSEQPVTLRFLATDYVGHLVHHLRQIGTAEGE